MLKESEALVDEGFIMVETADEKNARLELEIQQMKIVFEELERRHKILETEKHVYQNDLAEMKRENDDLKAKIAAIEGIRFVNANAKEGSVNLIKVKDDDEVFELIGEHDDLKAKIAAIEGIRFANANAKEGSVNLIKVKDEDEVFELMAENVTLKCEKDVAVKEIEMLRRELVELESRYLATHCRRQSLGNLPAATPPHCETYRRMNNFKVETGSSHMVFNVENRKNVKKQLLFKEEKSSSRKIAPPTPGVTNRPAISIIDLVDTDDELADCEDFSSVPTQKRKQPFNMVSSDSESNSENDHIPISKLKRMHLQDGVGHPSTGSFSIDENVGTTTNLGRRHLKKLRKFSPSVEEYDSAEAEDTDSNSGSDDSLGGFIVEDSDVSYVEDDSNSEDGSDQLEDSSDEDALISVIPSAIRRSKGQWKPKWEFEADMLAAFGKSPELCMEAVCALYRQQTDDEKCTRGTLHINGRGFSKFDALRGSDIAEFLTDGDPYGGLKKSLQELEEYDPKAPEVCQNLAARYSRQLFEIYTNEEDPFFFPDRVRNLGLRD